MSKPSAFSRLALPIFRWAMMIIAALIGGVLGVFGFAHVISMTPGSIVTLCSALSQA